MFVGGCLMNFPINRRPALDAAPIYPTGLVNINHIP
jgi:hypothetical protein